MNKEEQEAIINAKMFLNFGKDSNFDSKDLITILKLIEKQGNRIKCLEYDLDRTRSDKYNLDKAHKVIDLMAEDRADISEPKVSKQAIIDFYYKKVEEENG